MKKTQARRRLQEIENEYEVENRASNINRARSITVGKTTDGLTEIMMRSDGGRYIWYSMSAEDVTALVYQLASNVGCTVDIEARKPLRIKNNSSKTVEQNIDTEDKVPPVNKARSISVGTAFGGSTEIMMRSDDGRHIWCVMQPVEIIELIHQLSSNISCNADVKPRRDFASWRDWRLTNEEREHYGKFAPFVNDMAPFQQLGANMQKFQDTQLLEKINTVIKLHNSNLTPSPTPQEPAQSVPDAVLENKSNEQDNNTLERNFYTVMDGAPNLLIDPIDGICNKFIIAADGSEIMLGGAGGLTDDRIEQFIPKT